AAGDLPPGFRDLVKIDMHAHIFEYIPGFEDFLRENNLRLLNICVPATDSVHMKWQEEFAELMHLRYGKLHPFASTFPVYGTFTPGWSERAIAWLDDSFEQGAVLTKIWKEVGMELKTPSGQFLMPDNPVLDPVYDHLARLGKPLIAHLAEPIMAWQPLAPGDKTSYYATHPEWHFYGRKDMPTWEQIIQARDHVLEKHPDLIFIGAHLGSLEHNVDEVAKRLDRYPKFFVEIGGRVPFLMKQPKEKVRAFFIRYQDRIMYGTDIARLPGESPLLFKAQREKYFAGELERYLRDYRYLALDEKISSRGESVEGLGLPKEVLEKVYSRNAIRIVPGMEN
ncbi:MAG: amidohydrolase family protein, partial [Candidatus Glassbacteria bacterium]